MLLFHFQERHDYLLLCIQHVTFCNTPTGPQHPRAPSLCTPNFVWKRYTSSSSILPVMTLLPYATLLISSFTGLFHFLRPLLVALKLLSISIAASVRNGGLKAIVSSYRHRDTKRVAVPEINVS